VRRLVPALAAAVLALVVLVAGAPLLFPSGRDADAPTGPSSGSVPATAAPTPTASPAATPEPTPDVRVIPRGRPTASEHLAERLQEQLDRLRRRGGVPGVSATIIFADGSTWSGVSGLADVAGTVPVTPDTAFSIASMTKTFVAALTLALVEDGSFGLDDPAAGLLPGLGLDGRITVRQLLDHTSGLHDFFLAPGIDAALQEAPGAAWTAERALGYVGKPYFAPGTGWHYSNTNYLLLGLVAERVTGRSLAAELRARFLDPLGLSSAYVQVAEEPRGPIAHGYRFSGPGSTLPPIDLSDGSAAMPFTSVVTAAGGAGALAASSGDVARWGRLLYGGDVLAPESLALMTAEVDVVTTYRPLIPYGLGVQALDIAGHPTLGHSGRFLGFRGAVRYLLDEEVSIAVLTNQSRIDPGIIVRALLEIAIPHLGPCVGCEAPR
jgi:D-alanyl-D-alanine carboxypeptidase